LQIEGPKLKLFKAFCKNFHSKSNPKIKGALVNDTESLISQYADDTFLVLDEKEFDWNTSYFPPILPLF
jgi:hypothetical protein